MTRLYQLLIVLMLMPLISKAQNGQTFTLEQCIEYALQNSITLKNSFVDEDIAAARVKETRGIGLPQIDGSVQIVHNPKLPRMFGAYTPNGFLIQDPPQGTENNDVLSIPNLFQLKSSGDVSVTATQLLFNSSYLVGLKAAKTYRELSTKTSQQSKEQIVENITKAYYGALINEERIKLFDNNINRVDSLFSTTKALNQNGFAEAIDVDRIEVTLNNLKIEREKFLGIREISLVVLKFQMNYPLDQPINLSDDLSHEQIPATIMEEEGWNYSNRIDYSILETNYQLQKLDVQNKFSSSLPSLVAFGTFGYNTQSNEIGGLFVTKTSFSEESPDYGVDKWYSYSRIGLTLSVPIFSGLQRSYKLQQAKLNLSKIENGMIALKQGIDLSIRQNTILYNNAIKSLEGQRRNMSLAENVARVTKIKYEQGVGSNIEVIDAESSLREAQVNYYNALYDALVAKVDLDKAYGKLIPQTTNSEK